MELSVLLEHLLVLLLVLFLVGKLMIFYVT